MVPRLRVGLTGGIASGKSTVAQRFVELGVPVIDADEAARAVVALGTPGLEAVVRRFGAGVLSPSGELDRRALRERVFANPAERQDLERILHPLIRESMERRAADAMGPYLVLAIPLLIARDAGGRGSAGTGESSPYAVNRILVVDIDEAAQLTRLMARDGGSEAQARAILAAQAGRAARLGRADDVLHNSGSVAELRQAVDRLHQQYLRLAGAMLP
jgi:dephospho-CoA kinase